MCYHLISFHYNSEDLPSCIINGHNSRSRNKKTTYLLGLPNTALQSQFFFNLEGSWTLGLTVDVSYLRLGEGWLSPTCISDSFWNNKIRWFYTPNKGLVLDRIGLSISLTESCDWLNEKTKSSHVLWRKECLVERYTHTQTKTLEQNKLVGLTDRDLFIIWWN